MGNACCAERDKEDGDNSNKPLDAPVRNQSVAETVEEPVEVEEADGSGILTLMIVKGTLIRDTDLIGSMSPYCTLSFKG